MGRRRVDGLGLARRRPVTEAIARGTEMRAALDHPALETVSRRGTAASVRRRLTERVARPLPHVAGHVVQAIAVGRERPDRGRALVAVGEQVLPGELAL